MSFSVCHQFPAIAWGHIRSHGTEKNLIWSISLLLVFSPPFFLYVFAPLLRFNIWAGALTGGVFIGFVFSAGAGAIEAYIERVSRSRDLNTVKRGCSGVWAGRYVRLWLECFLMSILLWFSGWGQEAHYCCFFCCFWRAPVPARRQWL